MQEFSQRNIDRILREKEMLNKKLEYRMKGLDAWSKELDKKQALTELERLTLEEEGNNSSCVLCFPGLLMIFFGCDRTML